MEKAVQLPKYRSFLWLVFSVTYLFTACNQTANPEQDAPGLPAASVVERALTRTWELQKSTSNKDSLQADIHEQGTRLFLEENRSYTQLSPTGKASTGIWKIAITEESRLLIMVPNGQPMRQFEIKELTDESLQVYRKLEATEDGWAEEYYQARS